MKYYIIAGEASGDLHSANLMKEIVKCDSKASFRGIGGDKMIDAGLSPVKHYKDTSFMGFVEVIINLKTILAAIKLCKNDILKFKPDAIILVDYPGFNLRIAEFAKVNNIKVFYYISPQLWAWKSSRIKTIRKFVDQMFVILPFEKEFYNSYNYKVDFVGHPLIDAISGFSASNNKEAFCNLNKLNSKPIIALLPGSRKQEIAKMLPVMCNIINNYPDYQFVLAAMNSINQDFYLKHINNSNLKIIYNQTYDLLLNSNAAVVTSGTATLETALFNVPEVVCYKGSVISYYIAKSFVKLKYISLVNLILNKKAVTELIQNDYNTKNIIAELDKILFDSEYKNNMLENYSELNILLGKSGASEKTAKLIAEYIKTV